MSYGEGDPGIPVDVASAHRASLEAGQGFYTDPQTRLMVMTSALLKQAGECCGKGCRHCPYDAQEQERAGRKVRRPT